MGKGPITAPALKRELKLIEHSPVNCVNDPACQVIWQRVVVAFIESNVTKLVIGNDVLVKEAVKSALLGKRKSLKVAVRVCMCASKSGHNILLMFCL
jgi:hypothetical protein